MTLAYMWRTKLVCLKCSRRRMVNDLVPRGAVVRREADSLTVGRLRRLYSEAVLNVAHTTSLPASAPRPVTDVSGTCSTCKGTIK